MLKTCERKVKTRAPRVASSVGVPGKLHMTW